MVVADEEDSVAEDEEASAVADVEASVAEDEVASEDVDNSPLADSNC